MYKSICCILALLGLTTQAFSQTRQLDLLSPNGEIKVAVKVGDKIYYSISGIDEELLPKNFLMLNLRDDALGEVAKLAATKKGKGSEV